MDKNNIRPSEASFSKYGFIRAAAGAPRVKVADPDFNTVQIERMAHELSCEGARVIVFPELSITAYTCGDLFRQSLLLDKVEQALLALSDNLKRLAPASIVAVGAPLRLGSRLFNCAVIMGVGRILAVIPKTYLPSTNEFYEKRWFASSAEADNNEIILHDSTGREYGVPFGTDILVEAEQVKIGVEICEDLWVPVPPSCAATLAGADIILNLSATNELIGKHSYLTSLIKGQSARCRCGYVYASAGAGESSTDLVYAGNAIIAEDGNLLAESKRFTGEAASAIADIDVERLRNDRRDNNSFGDNGLDHESAYRLIPSCLPRAASLTGSLKLLHPVDPHPFVPADRSERDDRCLEVLRIQSAGLRQRLRATGCKSLTVGLSGGLDSTLAIIVAADAFRQLGLDLKGIHAITMPGFGTTDRTYHNALSLIKRLGVSGHEISIAEAATLHFRDIGHDINVHDVTYENGQARERTQILMDYANKTNGMVLGTGDLSELALGWCTYNGDQMSMYGVNASVPKTMVKHLVTLAADSTPDEELRHILLDIVDTPISPELIPAETDGTIRQKTEDLVGPYELHDFFLYNMLRYGFGPRKIFMLGCIAFEEKYTPAVIHKWLREFTRRFFAQQFKRSCMPDGPKTGSVCLSPRGDWRMPSDASSALWLAEIDSIEF